MNAKEKMVSGTKTTVFENDGQQFEENIRETVHDEKKICGLLMDAGFQLIKCDHHLLENEGIKTLGKITQDIGTHKDIIDICISTCNICNDFRFCSIFNYIKYCI